MGDAITIKRPKAVYRESRMINWLKDTKAVTTPAQFWITRVPSHRGAYGYQITQLSSPVIEVVEVDIRITEVMRHIESSSKILHYEEDWDDNGSAPISREAFGNATGFLLKFASWAYEYLKRSIPLPIISPGPDSSVELYWKKGKVDLLINFPADNLNIASFYGDDQSETIIEGTFPINKPQPGIFLTLLDG
ncbi:MAG: hypothetical protein KAR19_04925 [Bacteroidales bacterium]|nr:hypothetical protein [Bacteroidales bacterium]